jgi:signal transduction histidine kinase/DNA-binding NarL/FixJ family response regulator
MKEQLPFAQFFKEEQKRISRRFFEAIAVITLIFYALFFLVDYLYEYENIQAFILIRSISLSILLTLFLLFKLKPQININFLGILYFSVLAGSVCLMIAFSRDHKLSYYEGTVLALLCMGLFMPWKAKYSLTVNLAVYVFYIFTAVFLTDAWTWETVFIYNLYFVSVIVIIYVSNIITNRIRYHMLKNQFELARSNEQLQELNELKSNFIANISHEIRTPLTLILTPVESVIQGACPQPVPMSFFNSIRKNSLRLLNLFNNLLNFSQLDAGQTRIKINRINIVKVTEEAVKMIGSVAEAKKIRTSFLSPGYSIEIYSDIEKIDKILMNILSNALKFTPERGEISVEVDTEGNDCLISVKDTGIGIPREKIHTVFNRFSQADDSSTRRYEGSGLGLSLVKEFTRRLGGSVTLTSRDNDKNTGTEVIIKLPLGKNHLRHLDNGIISENQDIIESVLDMDSMDFKRMEELYQTADSSPGKTKAENRYSVLVVEDNRDLQNFLKNLLENHHYHVRTAADGEEGFKEALKHKPDLILTDVMMPGINGYELARKIKKTGELQSVPVIMLTARTDSFDKIEGLENGADDYLIKPFDAKELLARIRNLIKIYKYEKIITQQHTRNFSKQYNLSKREEEILLLIVRGLSNAEISKKLFISLSTVKNHISHIFEKVNAGSRFELISLFNNGFL